MTTKASNRGQLDFYSSSSIEWDSTSEHNNRDLSFYCDQILFVQNTILGNYSASADDGGQLDFYFFSSIGWNLTSEHSNWDLSFHYNQVQFIQNITLGNYSAGLDPQARFALPVQESYKYLFNTRYCHLHKGSVGRVRIVE